MLVQVHPRGAYGERIPGGNSGDHRKGVMFCSHGGRWQVQQDAVCIHQADAVALAYEGHRCAFDDRDAQLIGQQPHHGRVFHPGQLFQCRAPLAKRDVEDIAAQVRSEHGEQLGSRHLAVAHDLDGGRGNNTEAGIVTEKVTYQDGQKEQAAQRDDCCHCREDAARSGGRNETAPDWDASPCAQKCVVLSVRICVSGLFGRLAGSGALRRDVLRYFGARWRRGRGAKKLLHRFIVREHRYTVCL